MKTTQVPKGGDLAEFLTEVRNLWPAAKGSVAEIYKPCIRERCEACTEGRGHRAFIFSCKDGDKRRCLYVPANKVEMLRKAISNGRRIEQLLSKNGQRLVLNVRGNRK